MKQVNPRQYVAEIPQVSNLSRDVNLIDTIYDKQAYVIVLLQLLLSLVQLSNLEVWFQRPKDIVRKLLSGDLDLGIVGFDTFSEYGLVSRIKD